MDLPSKSHILWFAFGLEKTLHAIVVSVSSTTIFVELFKILVFTFGLSVEKLYR